MTVDKTGAIGENNKVNYTFPELCVKYMRGDVNNIGVYVDQKLESWKEMIMRYPWRWAESIAAR